MINDSRGDWVGPTNNTQKSRQSDDYGKGTHFLVFLGKTEWTGKITVIETNVFGILDSYNNLMSNLNEFRQQVDRRTK